MINLKTVNQSAVMNKFGPSTYVQDNGDTRTELFVILLLLKIQNHVRQICLDTLFFIK